MKNQLLCLAWSFGVLWSCSSGAPWTAEPSPDYDDSVQGPFVPPEPNRTSFREHYRVRAIGQQRPENPAENPDVVAERIAISRTDGKVLGSFRNTYYDFPTEDEFQGEFVDVFDRNCGRIAKVRMEFHDTLCVQGSGLLSSGVPVSFARRDCSCARLCPRTEQKICFDALDKLRFPWGRGATGHAITPLLTIAVDPEVIALNTSVYIPDFEGLPIDANQTAFHDGCFIAQDRGLKVTGKHVDIFTGERVITRLWNQLIPSNRGVTVVLDSPKCARAR